VISIGQSTRYHVWIIVMLRRVSQYLQSSAVPLSGVVLIKLR
jgi:hypothetical protein